jgi:hypothetical protein
MKQLKKSDLEIGDILIFEDFDFSYTKLLDKLKIGGLSGVFYYLLHYLIAWFDPGKEGANYKNIYHAGIWGNVDINRDKKLPPSFENCVVQAGTGGIGYASFEATMQHETVMNVYVCRLKNQTLNFHNEINESIREFYKVRGHYSFETAWMLSAICSMRYTKGAIFQIIKSQFGSLVAHYIVEAILEKINEYNDHHQREMVACSPLVAMMYKNAGHELPVYVFELDQNQSLPKPKFDLSDLEKALKPVQDNHTSEWPPINETVVTPRQLMESPAVELKGVIRHISKKPD